MSKEKSKDDIVTRGEIKTGHILCINCSTANILDLLNYDVYVCLDEGRVYDQAQTENPDIEAQQEQPEKLHYKWYFLSYKLNGNFAKWDWLTKEQLDQRISFLKEKEKSGHKVADIELIGANVINPILDIGGTM